MSRFDEIVRNVIIATFVITTFVCCLGIIITIIIIEINNSSDCYIIYRILFIMDRN